MASVEIPYGCYWSTPFTRWQGALAHLNAVQFGAWVAKREMERRAIDPSVVDHCVLGITVFQHHSFFGLPWFTGLAGMGHVTGQTLSQACATGARALLAGKQEIDEGLATVALVATTDRCSNGPHVHTRSPAGRVVRVRTKIGSWIISRLIRWVAIR
jgi:acetyl-CoA acetyltransferase